MLDLQDKLSDKEHPIRISNEAIWEREIHLREEYPDLFLLPTEFSGREFLLEEENL